jgi:predicted Zn-ribbon and HTH transcriptional regulator
MMTCPKCKSDNAHRSHRRNSLERALAALGFYPYRCQKCDHRFRRSAFALERTPSQHASTEREIRATRGKVTMARRRRELVVYGGSFAFFLAFLYYITRERGGMSDGN